MATTVTAQTLTVTHTTKITLNGNERNTVNEVSIANINEYDSRIMTIPSSAEATVVAFNTAVAAGTFIRGDLKYLQITNLDAVNYARIRVTKTSGSTFDQKLDAGQSFIMCNTSESASESGAAFATFVDADNVAMQANNAPVDIEYVVAST